MKPKSHFLNTIFIIFSAFLLFYAIKVLAYSTGPPDGRTNAPGESNCTACHTGTLITGGTVWNNINLTTNIPATGYVPDSLYSVTFTITQSGINKFGFETTVLETTNNTKAGILIVTNSTRTQLSTGTRDYIKHTSAGTSGSGSNSWTFNWKAPSTNVGSIRFYFATNAANGNNNPSGDMIYAKTFTHNVSSLLPTAFITASKLTACVGETINLSGSGNNTPTNWYWSLPDGTPDTANTQNTNVVYNSTGTYTVTLVTTNGIGTSTPTTKIIQIVGQPNTAITVTGSLDLCPGDSVMLSAPSGNGYQYLWSNSLTTQSIIVKSAGTFNVKVTNSTGCFDTSPDTTVTLKSAPNVTLTSSISNDTICIGDSITFFATSGLTNYIFMDGSTILQSDTLITYITDSLSANNDIFVKAGDMQNCYGTSNHIITEIISPLSAPNVSCGSATTSSVQFNWDTVAGAIGYEVSTDSEATWNTPSSGTMGVNHIITGLNYNQSFNLHIRAFNDAPCFKGMAAITDCNSLPCSPFTYNLNYDSLICKGDSTLISINNLSINKFSINFDSQGYAIDTTYWIKPNITTSYTILIIDSNILNCPPLQLQVEIIISSIPMVSLISDKPNNSICDGDSITFSADTGYVKYYFIKNSTDTLQDGVFNSFITSMLSDGDEIQVTVINDVGCTDMSSPLPVTVNSNPVISIESDKLNNSICEGDDITFSSDTGYAKYFFIKNSSDTLQDGPFNSFTTQNLSDNDEIQVTAISNSGCSGTSSSLMVHVNPLPKPGFTNSQSGMTISFNDTTRNAAGWNWDFGDQASDTIQNPTHEYDSAGMYTVVLSIVDSNGCEDAIIEQIEVNTTSIAKPNETYSKVKIFVNHTNNELIINFDLVKNSHVNLNLWNVNGILVKNILDQNLLVGEHKFVEELNDLATGIYFAKFFDGQNVIFKKILIGK